MGTGNEKRNRINPSLRLLSTAMSVLLVFNLVPAEALAELRFGRLSPQVETKVEDTSVDTAPAEEAEVVDHTTKQPPVDILSHLSHVEIESAIFDGSQYQVMEDTPYTVKFTFEETASNQFQDDYEYYFRLPEAFLPTNGQPYLDGAITVRYLEQNRENYLTIDNNEWFIANNEVHFRWNQADGSGFSYMHAQDLTSFDLRVEGTFLPNYTSVDFGAGFISLKFPDPAPTYDENGQEVPTNISQPTETSTVFEFGQTSALEEVGVPVQEGANQAQPQDTVVTLSEPTQANPVGSDTAAQVNDTAAEVAEALSDIAQEVKEDVAEQVAEKEFVPGTRSQFTYEDDQVLVIANATDPSAIPEGAELRVKPILPYQGEFGAYIASLNNASDKTYSEENTILFDIAFFLDGEEVQPKEGTVDVTIKFKKYQLKNEIGAASLATVEVNHLPVVDGNIVVESVDADVSVQNEVAQLNAESFSVYSFSYTVDFVFDGYTYKLPGSGSVALSSLLASLGINESVSAVESVEFSNPDVLQVNRDFRDLVGSEWVLVSLKPFDTVETLTVKMSNGSVYLIEVKDPELPKGIVRVKSIIKGYNLKSTDNFPFEFSIAPAESYGSAITMPEETKVVVYNDGSGTFEPITFNKAGTYKFTVSEGFTRGIDELANDKDPQTVTFVVEDDGFGDLEVVSPDQAEATLEFTNKKCVTIRIKKYLQDSTGETDVFIEDWPTGGKAKFSVERVDEDGNKVEGAKEIVYPDDVIAAGDYSAGNNEAVFKICYNSSYYSGTDVPWTYYYEFGESLSGEWPSGWKYDEGKVKATVNVFAPSGDDVVVGDDNAFTYDISYQKQFDVNGRATYLDLEDGVQPFFINTYEPSPATVSIRVQKVIEGRNWRRDGDYTDETKTEQYQGDCFLFHLDKAPAEEGEELANDYAELGNQTIKIIDQDTDHIETFENIKLNRVGRYKFKVQEEDPSSSVTDMIYDTKAKIVYFDVVDDGSGNLVATMSSGSEESVDPIVVTNVFGNFVPLSVSKNLAAGDEWPEGGKAIFQVIPVNNAPAPMEPSSVTLEGVGTAAFGGLRFTKPGTYVYDIVESTESFGKDWAKDPQRIRVTVKVEKTSGATAKVSSLTSTVTYEDQSGKAIEVADNTVEFTNSNVGNGKLMVVKKLAGSVPDKSLINDIAISVTDASGDVQTKTLGDDFTLESDGTYSTTFEGLTAGLCKVSESGKEVAGYEVMTSYTLPSGRISDGEVNVEDGMTSYITITNTYTRSRELKVKEVVAEGNEWPSEGKATVSLAIPEGNPAPTNKGDKTLSAAGYADFGTFNSHTTTAGDYVYTITNTNDFADGWVTTPDKITAKVQVDDAGIPTITYEPSDATFVNEYVGTGDLKLVKTVTGATLTDEQKQSIKTTVVDAAGTSHIVTFDLFTEESTTGQYTYTLENVTAGKYTVYEEAVIDDYELFINSNPVTGKANVGTGTVVKDVENTFTTINDRYAKPSDLPVVVKVAGDTLTSSEESSTTIEIVDQNENVVRSAKLSEFSKSDEGYTATFGDLHLYKYGSGLSGIYYVRETDAPERDLYALTVTYSPSDQKSEVKGDGSDASAVTVTNTFAEKGSLTITKNISGATLSNSDMKNIEFDVYYGDELYATVPLSDFDVVTRGSGYSYTFVGLDAGKYTIEETILREKENYDVTINPASTTVDVTNGANKTATITNTYKINATGNGRITIFNSVVSNTDSDKSKSFNYKLTLSGDLGKAVTGTHGDLSFSNGEASFTLKDGESKTASDLPNVSYTVTQTSADGFSTSSSGTSGTISSNTRASFTNTRNASNTTNNTTTNNSTTNNSANNSSNSNNSSSTSNTTTGSNGKVTIRLTANKRLTGRTLVANEFSFTLRDGNGQVLQTKTNSSSGSITFDGIDLSSEGTYTYIISEVRGTATGITYDTHEARVTVTVTKDSSGTFTARAAYDSANTTTFNNTYTGPGSTATTAQSGSSTTSGTAATETAKDKEELATTADPTLVMAIPTLVTVGFAGIAAGTMRRRKRK